MKSVFFKAFLFLFILNLVSCSKVEFINPIDVESNNAQFRTEINDLNSQFFPFQDVDSHNFFPNSVHNELNDFTIEVYKELERQNGTDPFVENIVSRIGIPLWNNLLASNAIQNYERYLLIPFDNESGEVSGLIYCVETVKGKYQFALIEKSILVEFVQNNPAAWNNIASYLVVSFHFFDQFVFGASNGILLQFMSSLEFNGASSSRDDCYNYYDCILPAWEGSQYANYDFVTGGVTNTSIFLGNFLLNQNIAWLEIFYGGLECIEIEVCPSGPPIIFFQNDWTPGYTPTNNSGGITTNETPSGANNGLNLTLEELDEFEMQLFLFARDYDLPFSINEMYNWVSYDCMNANDRLNMSCAMESFTNNFVHPVISPFLEELDWDINGLVNSSADIGNCLNSDDFGECIIIELTEELEGCGTYDFIWCNNLVDSPNGICPESFKFTPLGNNATYTCDIRDVSFKYKGAVNQSIFIGDICITVPKRDFDGMSLEPFEASELFSDVWNEAMDLTAFAYANSNHTLTSVAYRNLFLTNLRITMVAYFQGTFGQGTMNLSNQNCSGSVPFGRPKYSIFC